MEKKTIAAIEREFKDRIIEANNKNCSILILSKKDVKDILCYIISLRLDANKFIDYDDKGVRAFVRYAESSGAWAVECYRKKTTAELLFDSEKKGIPSDSNWQMIRVGHIPTYYTRLEAEIKALELAESIIKEFQFNQ